MKPSRCLPALCAALVFFCPACDRPGLTEAERDIAAGKLCLKDASGLPADVKDYETPLWRERYSVEKVRVVANDRAEEKRIDDYNRRMLEEIEKKHGAGVAKKISDEAILKLAEEKLHEKTSGSPQP